MLDGRRRHETRKLVRRIRQHEDPCASRFPSQERRGLIEPDEIHFAPAGPRQAHLKIELGRQGQIRIAGDDPDVDVTVGAQLRARA